MGLRATVSINSDIRLSLRPMVIETSPFRLGDETYGHIDKKCAADAPSNSTTHKETSRHEK